MPGFPDFPRCLAMAVLLAAIPLPSHGEEPPAIQKHALDPVLHIQRGVLRRMERIRDYSALLVKRERTGAKLGPHEYCFIKVRHDPFSVYMKFLKSRTAEGREVIYVEGENNGKLLAHDLQFNALGTVALEPDSAIAMRDQRHPITQVGIKNLMTRLVEQAERQKRNATECTVRFFQEAKINDRSATCIEVVRPHRSQDVLFHRVRVYIDDQLNLPIRYEGYDWPQEAGAEPALIEEYTYLNLRLNNNFDDTDFDVANPSYDFPGRSALGRLLLKDE